MIRKSGGEYQYLTAAYGKVYLVYFTLQIKTFKLEKKNHFLNFSAKILDLYLKI